MKKHIVYFTDTIDGLAKLDAWSSEIKQKALFYCDLTDLELHFNNRDIEPYWFMDIRTVE